MAIELGLHKAEYESLIQDLEALGHRVRLRPPTAERSATSAAGQLAFAVAVYLAEFVEEHVVDAISTLCAPRRYATSNLQRLSLQYGGGGAPGHLGLTNRVEAHGH